jgi:hypothetical protein
LLLLCFLSAPSVLRCLFLRGSQELQSTQQLLLVFGPVAIGAVPSSSSPVPLLFSLQIVDRAVSSPTDAASSFFCLCGCDQICLCSFRCPEPVGFL